VAKTKRILLNLKCADCSHINYITSKNPTENKEKLELNKFCKQCRKQTPHKEAKVSKAQK